MDGHRHTLGPEHDFEPVPGLPEALPAGCASGVPSGRTCAIGLAELAGGRYRSFVQLVDGCAMPLEAAVEVSA